MATYLGTSGADTILASGLDDTVLADAGNDVIDGGTGNDSLDGGAGDDRFVLTAGFGNDTITGGTTGEVFGDVLDASGIAGSVQLDLSTVNPDDPTSGTLIVGADIHMIRVFKPNTTVTGFGVYPNSVINFSNGTWLYVPISDLDSVFDDSQGYGYLPSDSSQSVVSNFDGQNVAGSNIGSPGLSSYTDSNGNQFWVGYLETYSGTALPYHGYLVVTDAAGATPVGSGTYANQTTPSAQIPYANFTAASPPIDQVTFTEVENVLLGAGSDIVTGSNGNDSVAGGAGQDTMDGGAGNDTLSGEAGRDSLTGGTGDDTLSGGADADSLFGGANNDVLDGGDGADSLYGGDGNDSLYGGGASGTGADTLAAGEGDDLVDLGLNGGTAYGGAGTDTMFGSANTTNTLHGELGEDLLYGGSLNDALYGGADSDTIFAQDGNDIIDDGMGDDLVYAGAGNDEINISGGKDTVFGEEGDDTVIVSGDLGDATLFGGTGSEVLGDTLNLGNSGAALVYDLTDADASSGSVTDGTGTLTYSEFESLSMGYGSDTLVLANGFVAPPILNFSAPSDYGNGIYYASDKLDVSGLLNSSGNPVTVNDVIVGSDGASGSILYFPNGETLTLVGLDPSFLATPQALGAIGIPTGLGDGIVNGTSDADYIDTGYVDPNGDQLDGTDGLNDVIEAGAGDDTVLAQLGDDLVSAGEGADNVDGGRGDDTLQGEAGDDMLYGGLGNDFLVGGEGSNYLDGGDGNDTISVFDGADVSFGGGGDDLIAYYTLNAGGFVDAGEHDETTGDTLSLSHLTSPLRIDLTSFDPEFGQVSDGTASFSYAGIETLILGSGADTLVLASGSGNDTVHGFVAPTDNGDGTYTATDLLDVTNLFDLNGHPVNVNDVVVTADGAGNAVLVFVNGETLTLTGVDPASLGTAAALGAIGIPIPDGIVHGSTASDFIIAGYADAAGDEVDGSDGLNDTIYGNAGLDYIVAGEGDDLVYGGADADTIDGGPDGDDTLFGDAGDDTLTDGVTGDDLLYGGEGNDALTTGAGNDTLFGDVGNDTLMDADSNDDQLYGGDGEDALFTWGGADSLYGGADNDLLDASGSVSAATLYGDAGDDYLFGSAAIDAVSGQGDSLFGGEGNDSLIGDAGNDSLEGGLGSDNIDAGADDDLVHGDDGNDEIFGQGGNDTLFGDAGDDMVMAGDGNDTLYGGDGSDILNGDGDRDYIYGGAGDVVDGGATGDDFDVLNLSQSGFAGTNILYDPLNSENGTVEFLDGAGAVVSTLTFSNIEQVIACFTPGSRVLTDRGLVDVADLKVGQMVLTRDHGLRPVRWVGRRDLDKAALVAEPAFHPVQIAAGAMGCGLPTRDMLVSPQHRMLISSQRAELYFGEFEVLIPACHLVGQAGIDRLIPQAVSYIHFMFDDHEIVQVDGLWTESFQPGAMALAGLEDAQRTEIFSLFPELATGQHIDAARMTLKSKETALLLGASGLH